MPWVCSDTVCRLRCRVSPGRLATRLASAVAGSTLIAGITINALPGWANSRWRLGVFPVASFVAYTSHYGSRFGPGGSVEPHYGLDIAAPLGSGIRSWWAGVVQEVINDGACGVGLVIRSGAYEHIYCHLAGSGWDGTYRSGAVVLQRGQAVSTGQLIGHVGLSGRTTGPHLHWGVRHQGQWLDPAQVLRAMARSRRSVAAAPKRLSPPRVRRSPSGLLQP
jgi:murein DD-endopeptidase MepM/ murein hydrolase activator NlpD